MATINSFEELNVWQKSRDLCRQVFLLLQGEKFAKDYALKDQINRSSGSVMDNIAEGFGRQGTNEFINYLRIASGSLLEGKSQLYRVPDRKHISQTQHDDAVGLIVEIGKTVTARISYPNKSDIRGLKFKNRTPGAKPTKNYKLF